MSKFDLVERFNFLDLMAAVFATPSEPRQLLKKSGIIKGNWQTHYFNWGRNALYFLFKELSFKKISFPAFTCPTLTKAAEAAGKKIELLEVDRGTFNLDLKKLESKKIECLVVVHTFGNPVDLKKIREILPNTFIIEDCAHSLFAKINEEYVGSRGDVILFSLYKQTANINGSLLLSKREFRIKQKEEGVFDYPKRLLIRTKGPCQFLLNIIRKRYLPVIEQFSYNNKKPNKLVFSFFQKNLSKLEKEIIKRRKVSLIFKKYFTDHKYFTFQKEEDNSEASYYQFPILLKEPFIGYRDQLGLYLRANNIFVDRLWFDAPITQSEYRRYQKDCPEALFLAENILNLPIRGSFTEEEVRQLTAGLTDFFETIR